MGKYTLSKTTQDDIEEIFEYGTSNFGNQQVLEYLKGLRYLIELLAQNPKMEKKRNEIKNGLVSFPYGSHIVFYRIFIKQIRIVRVLFGGRDLVKFLT